ncbi:MAG: PHP domain-containing protein [Lachnospiraceae bacterium]|nr:PHP domain-containing protein [Lachnospiraceae bacterium]
MQYQIMVDGKRVKVEIPIRKYSLEADNTAREQIIRHYLDEVGAKDVVIETAADELVRYAYDHGYKSIVITDCRSVQAFSESYREWSRLWKQYQKECRDTGKEAVLKDFLKIIYGFEGNLLTQDGKVFPVLIYVKNETGLRNLYKIVTASYLEYCNNKTPMIPRALLEQYRDGLLISELKETKEIPDFIFDDCSNLDDQIGYVRPLREGKYWPEYPDADKELREICERRVKELFGDKPNSEVRERMEQELNAICQNGYAGIYMLWRLIVKKSLDEGYPVGIRGAVGSSFVAYLCGITEINPLSYESGGYNIPLEVFMGLNLDKEPDIDINFSPVIQETVQNYIKDLPGVGETCYGGTISIKNGKKINGIHPGGIIVCPEGEELVSFTPLNHPHFGNKITTHFSYHDISNSLLKLDILGHDKYELLHFLQENTGMRIEDISLDDKKALDLIRDGSIPLIRDLPEFGSELVRKMIAETKPETFTDLIKIDAMSHGTEVWYGNQEEAVRNGEIKLSDCIASRDDIMLYLMGRNIDKNTAYQIMEYVRKGRGLNSEHRKIMKEAGIPEWYIKACKKIKYLFPKAHAVSYTMMAVRLAYYMIRYPEVYSEGLSAVG